MSTEDEMTPAPKEQRETITKPKQILPTPSKELGIIQQINKLVINEYITKINK